MWWEKLQKEILNTDLYSRSGTEVGVSDGTLKLKESGGDYFVVKTGEADIPEISYKASCDLGINYPELNKFVFGKLPHNWLIGEYKKIFVGYFANKNIRKRASSGGIISGSQTYLMERGMIDGAITLRMRKDKPFLTEPIIATTADEIAAGAQSKYTISPVNQILEKLPGKYKSLSYVGLPEQVAAIRKLQKYKHKSVKNISYIFGLFHGETISFNAIKSFLRTHGVKSVDDIVSLEYRAGEWPGYMRVKLKNSRIISVKKFYANYLIPSHITKYSFYQVDYMNELADISVGDAWAPQYEERGKGWSVIIARSDKGLNLINDMIRDKRVVVNEITETELINMHSHGLDFKKRGAFIRIERRREKGLPVPEYGYKPINIPYKRKYFEGVLHLLFVIFQSKLTIFFLEKLPPAFIGKFFVGARNLWKKRTRSTKKGGLFTLEFKVKKFYDK